jgi:hypothetical protein
MMYAVGSRVRADPTSGIALRVPLTAAHASRLTRVCFCAPSHAVAIDTWHVSALLRVTLVPGFSEEVPFVACGVSNA